MTSSTHSRDHTKILVSIPLAELADISRVLRELNGYNRRCADWDKGSLLSGEAPADLQRLWGLARSDRSAGGPRHAAIDCVIVQPSPTLREQLTDPRSARVVQGTALLSLTLLSYSLCRALDLGTATDVDTVNLGLSALDFNPAEWRPHPPGTPGYVVFLRVLHALTPISDVVTLARVGSALCAAACVPAAWWATRALVGHVLGRPIAAAALAAVHPLIWYSGADGQSHAAEALLAILIFGGAATVRGRGLGWALLLVAGTALAGSVRPTVALLTAPVLIWVFWGRRSLHWGAALAVGVATVASWTALALSQTDAEAWSRAQDALVFDLFVSRFGLLGGSFDPVLFGVNAQILALGLVLSLLPTLGWTRGTGSWRWAFWATIAVHGAFYLVLYASEPGYLAAVAGLAVLTPASWSPRAPLRATIGPLLGLAFVSVGPATVPLLGVPGNPRLWLPTAAHVVRCEAGVGAYLDRVCDPDLHPMSLFLDTGGENLAPRLAAVRCQRDVVMVIDGLGHAPDLDVSLVFSGSALMGLPTGIPLEAGPEVEFRYPRPVEQVVLAPFVPYAFARRIAAQARCEATSPGIWPARCLPVLELGKTRMIIEPLLELPGGP